MTTEISNEPNKPKLQSGVVSNSADFEEAVLLFQSYKPVKVAKELKDEFSLAISRHFIDMCIGNFSYTIYPLVKSYKFKRKAL